MIENRNIDSFIEIMNENLKSCIGLLDILYNRVVEQEAMLTEIKKTLKKDEKITAECGPSRRSSIAEGSLSPNTNTNPNPNPNPLHDSSETLQQDQMDESSTTSENRSEMMCYDCNTMFKRGSGEFTRHAATSGCKPYRCDVCLKLFKKRANLNSHLITHAAKSFICHCGMSFGCAEYLKKHKKRVHDRVSKEQSVPKEKVEKPPVIVKKEKEEDIDEPSPKRLCIDENKSRFNQIYDESSSNDSIQD